MASSLDHLLGWVSARLSPTAKAWWTARRDLLTADPTDRNFTITFGMVPRKLGRADLALGEAELTAANAARQDWDPSDWSVDQAARVALMLEFGGTGDAFVERLARMAAEAEVSEAIALFRGLPLYPHQEQLEPIAGEGLRTNVLSVFEAVAHRSPFPKEQFDENRFNQMVVKAVFVGSYLNPIQGLDERVNDDLAIILIDTARERRAAGRDVSFEVWRCIGPCARQDMIGDMQHELENGDVLGRQAAALALAAAPNGIGRAVLDVKAPDLAAAIEDGSLSWPILSQQAGRGVQQHFARPDQQ